MTEDLHATYETIDALQQRGDYSELRQMAQYIINAIENDGAAYSLLLNGKLITVGGDGK